MNKITATDVIQKLMSQVEGKKPTAKEMLEDLRVMQFKVKPLYGDITSLTKIYSHFIESVWNMTKIDEIVNRYMDDLDDYGQDQVLNFLDDMESRQVGQMKQMVGHLSEEEIGSLDSLRLEIYRSPKGKKKIVN